MKKRNLLKVYGSKVAAVALMGLGCMTAANAAWDTSALTTLVTDIAAIGVAVFAVYVAIFGSKSGRKAL